MDKLKVVIMPEKTATVSMAHCGKYSEQLCGLKECSWNGAARDD